MIYYTLFANLIKAKIRIIELVVIHVGPRNKFKCSSQL